MSGPYGVTTSLDLWLLAEWLYEEFVRLHKRMDAMALVQVEQDDLDALAQQITDAATALSEQLAALEAAAANPAEPVQLPAGSLDGLKSAVTTLQGLETPAVAPAPEAPADTTPPAVDTTAPPTATTLPASSGTVDQSAPPA